MSKPAGGKGPPCLHVGRTAPSRVGARAGLAPSPRRVAGRAWGGEARPQGECGPLPDHTSGRFWLPPARLPAAGKASRSPSPPPTSAAPSPRFREAEMGRGRGAKCPGLCDLVPPDLSVWVTPPLVLPPGLGQGAGTQVQAPPPQRTWTGRGLTAGSGDSGPPFLKLCLPSGPVGTVLGSQGPQPRPAPGPRLQGHPRCQ